MDVDTIPFGVDFRKYVDDALERTDFLLVIIGSHWLGPRADGGNRIHDGNDPVRMEIAAGLRNGVTTVIPLLIDGALMPTPAMLPQELRPLSDRNAAEISSGRDFTAHITRVIRFIDEALRDRVSDHKDDFTLPSTTPASQTGSYSGTALPVPEDAGIVTHHADKTNEQRGAQIGRWRLPVRASYAVPAIALVTIILVAAFAPSRFKVGALNVVPIKLGPYNFYPPPQNKPELQPEKPQASVTPEAYVPSWAFVARKDQSASVTCREWSGSNGRLESPPRSTPSALGANNPILVKYNMWVDKQDAGTHQTGTPVTLVISEYSLLNYAPEFHVPKDSHQLEIYPFARSQTKAQSFQCAAIVR